MFQWRLKLREAQRAIAVGRYEEAYRLLSDEQLREFLPAKQLADELAKRFADRAAKRIEWGQSTAGFADLAAVDKLGAGQQHADDIRHDYAERAAQTATNQLAAGEPQLAQATLQRAERRVVDSSLLRPLTQIADAWQESQQHSEAGDMLRAESMLERARTVCQSVDTYDTIKVRQRLDLSLESLRERTASLTEIRERMHEAAIANRWPDVLRDADLALRLAPRDAALVTLRRRAWRELELDKTKAYGTRPQNLASEPMNGHPGAADNARRLARAIRQSTQSPPASKQDTAIGAPPANRRMLWVDSVGGFLVCLDEEIVIGQPAGGATPTLPILADISRRHAIVRREQGAYVIEPIGPTMLDGKKVAGPTVLGDSHTIELGDSVKLKFERPHALSATARLTVTSGHRTAPSADAVLLMAESCVLGAGKHSHVRCRGWEQDVILFRQGEEIRCRSSAELTHDGHPCEGPCRLEDGSRIEGQDFAMCVEVV